MVTAIPAYLDSIFLTIYLLIKYKPKTQCDFKYWI
jgi:hypothetical protein